MKRILLLIAILLFPVAVNASSVGINISCSKNVLRPGESTTCVLVGKTDVKVGGVNFKILTDDNLEVSNFKKNSGIWTMGDLANTDAALLTTSPVDGTFNIGSFTIKAVSSISSSSITSTVRITNISMSVPSDNFAVVNGTNKSVTITISKTASNTSTGGNGTGPGTGNSTTNTNTNTSNSHTNTTTNTNSNKNTTPNTNQNTVTNNNTTSNVVNNTTNNDKENTTNDVSETITNIIENKAQSLLDNIQSSVSTKRLTINNFILTISFIMVFAMGVAIGVGFGRKK